MLEIKLITKYNALGDRTFYDFDDVMTFFRERWVSHLVDYILIINGRRYEWPNIPYNLIELGDHLRYCVDMDEAFYETS